MAGDDSQWLLRVYVLLMMFQPLSHSSRPEGNMATLDQLLKEMEEQAMGPETTPLWVVVAETLLDLVLELLVTEIVLRCCLGRRLWRFWRQEQRQSPSVSAGPCGRRGRGCCQELLQLLRHNRALMRLCLRHSSRQRPRHKRPARWGLWKRRRLRFSPQL